MSRTAKIATTAGAFVAAGAVATLLNDRQRTRRRRRRGEEVEFGSVRSSPLTVMASDGVALSVQIDEAKRKTPTVLFMHGWVEDSDVWHYQRLALRGTVRTVFVDLRSHGRSGRSYADSSSLADLADDLATVIKEVAPRGPLVLVGHSMGGMAIMQLARSQPQLFGRRVKGVVLIATSSGKLMRSGPALRHLVPMLRAGTPVLDWGRRFNSYSVIRRWGLGPYAKERHVDMTNEMILRLPTRVLTDFYPNFVGMDLTEGLADLSRARTTVIVGTADMLTPVKHGRELAGRIPDARLIVLDDIGHLVPFEAHEVVTKAIEDTLEDIGT